jgi:hypothetical protein
MTLYGAGLAVRGREGVGCRAELRLGELWCAAGGCQVKLPPPTAGSLPRGRTCCSPTMLAPAPWPELWLLASPPMAWRAATHTAARQ